MHPPTYPLTHPPGNGNQQLLKRCIIYTCRCNVQVLQPAPPLSVLSNVPHGGRACARKVQRCAGSVGE